MTARTVVIFSWIGLTFATSVRTLTAVPEVTVVGDKISLGMLLTTLQASSDLTELLNNTIVTDSPKAGRSKIVEAAEIHLRLESVGIHKGDHRIQVPESIKVTRKAQTIRALEIEDKVKTEFLPTLPLENVKLERVDIPESVQVPVGQVNVTFDCSPHTDFARPFYLTVSLAVDGQSVAQAFYRTELIVNQTVPVTTKELDRAATIGSTDVLWEKRRLSSTLRVPVRQTSFFEQKRLKQRVPAGKVLTEDLFVHVPMINRGDQIVLLFQNEKLRITTTGKSLTAGSQGERVRVINLDSKKELVAEVLDKKTARVVVSP
jgi:flagella basal body P-ring formation protein FlgA